MRSIHHRGTEAAPGLVLALDTAQGAFCDGVAFRVAEDHQADTLAYLRERELVSSAYLEQTVQLTLQNQRKVDAVAYVVDREHVQYCTLALDEQAQIIAQAVGGRGPNTEYLYNTAEHLTQLGIADTDLTELSLKVRAITNRGAPLA